MREMRDEDEEKEIMKTEDEVQEACSYDQVTEEVYAVTKLAAHHKEEVFE